MAKTDESQVLTSLLTKLERIPIAQLKQFPGNPNEGDVDAIAESMRVNGLFEPVIVQKSTGHILSHNHVTRAAAKLGWTHLDCIRVDVDAAQAARIVAAANRTAERSKRNDFLLADLLREISDDDLGLEGTGYDDRYMEDLLLRVEPELPPAAPAAAHPVFASAADEDEGDGAIILPPGPSGAHYAETEEQEAARSTRVAGERSLAAKGLTEVVFVMELDDKAQLLNDVEALRDHLGDEPTGPIIATALRVTRIVLEAAHHNAPPLEWKQLLGQAAVRLAAEAEAV